MVLFRGEQYFHNNPSVLTDKLYLSAARVISSRLLVDLGITCVINATLELPTMAYNTPDCLQIAVEDRVASKLYIYFDLVADKINSIHAQPNGRLLIYCRAGMSRSASLCIAYFIKYHKMTLDEAFAYVKERRPIIHPNIGFLRQLRDYEKKLQAIRSGVECPLSYQKRCDVPLPPLTYATQDSCDDPVRDYDVQTKVIKPKPKPRKPKINFTEVMELCAETYQTTSVQICSERELHSSSCSNSTNVISIETSVTQMTEPTGAVATVRAPTTTFDTMDSEDLRSLFQNRRVPFTKLSEPGKIAVSYLQLQLDHLEIPFGGGSPDIDLINNPLHAFSVFTELRVFLANTQTITLECLGDNVPQNINASSNCTPQLASACDWFVLENLPHATCSFVFDVHCVIENNINQICFSVENFKRVEMNQLAHLQPRPQPELPSRQNDNGQVKRTGISRSSIQLPGLRISPVPKKAQATLALEKNGECKSVCLITHPSIIFEALNQCNISFDFSLQWLTTDFHVKRYRTCHCFQALTLETHSEEQLREVPCVSVKLVFGTATLISQFGLEIVENYFWDDVYWMSANEIMPGLEYPFYKTVMLNDPERLLLKALEGPPVEVAWCFALNRKKSPTSVCFVVQKRVITPSNKRQSTEPEMQWANDEYHVDLSFAYHETYPFDALEMTMPKVSVVQEIKDSIKRAVVVIAMDEAPLHSLTNLKRFQFQKYSPWFITNICVHPMIQVSEQSLQLALEMVNFYCEPTIFDVNPILVLWTSLANQVASRMAPDIRYELMELVCIPDAIGDMQTLKSMILCQSDLVKIGIWLEVFERSVINARPIYPLITRVDAFPLAIKSEVNIQGWTYYDIDVRPRRCFHSKIGLEMQYQTQTCYEVLVLENTENLHFELEDAFTQEALISEPSYVFAYGTCYEADDISLWDDSLVLKDTHFEEGFRIRALLTLSPFNELACHKEVLIYGECEPLRIVALSWMERQAFTKVTPLLSVASIKVYEAMHMVMQMPKYEFVQDVEDFPDWGIVPNFIFQCQDRLTGPLDTFWYFDMSKAPSNQAECLAPTNLKLFLPDPETVDRLEKQCSSSSSVERDSDKNRNVFRYPHEPEQASSVRLHRANVKKHVSFQEATHSGESPDAAVSHSWSPVQFRQISSKGKRSRSSNTRSPTITTGNLVSFQRPRNQSKNRSESQSKSAKDNHTEADDRRIMANLEASVRQSSDLLLQIKAGETSPHVVPGSSDFNRANQDGRNGLINSEVRYKRGAARGGDAPIEYAEAVGSSPVSELTLRSLLESAQKWVRYSSTRPGHRERSRSRHRR